jgi:hypothetical protein
MICRVFDGVFDSLYLYEFFYSTIQVMPVNITNIANRSTMPYGHKGSHTLLGHTILKRSSINKIDDIDTNYYPQLYSMYELIEEFLGVNFYLSAITTNIQPTGCDGTTHSDAGPGEDDEYTILVMTNPEWKKEWGGQFQLIDPETANGNGDVVIEEHDYVPGRIILLPSPHPHRGLGPKEKYVYRSSIVFRVTPNFEKHLSLGA